MKKKHAETKKRLTRKLKKGPEPVIRSSTIDGWISSNLEQVAEATDSGFVVEGENIQGRPGSFAGSFDALSTHSYFGQSDMDAIYGHRYR